MQKHAHSPRHKHAAQLSDRARTNPGSPTGRFHVVVSLLFGHGGVQVNRNQYLVHYCTPNKKRPCNAVLFVFLYLHVHALTNAATVVLRDPKGAYDVLYVLRYM